ncbi:hypothetical protein SAMN05660206_1157 [Sphingobacterium wenxiniae]|uniref:Uncharacterized protein n=2 Tax=Sphingobacterium wenxiniae TaxID=683125 RepID=A0A1I6VL12_9SPHI|nr:hypothetical protein SAMN05660206_1157 [Sphingobacterium wenxiniae]
MKTLSEITLSEIETAIYKKDIYFFNRKEQAMLKGIREFLKDPDNFSTQYYKPIIVKDSLRYVYPENQPAYHKDNTCPRLQSNFINFEIPEEVREKGENEIKRFRAFFAEHKHLLESNIKAFIEKMQARFFITREINPKSIDYSNSGNEQVKNYSVQDLENEIDEILRQAGKFYTDNPDKQEIIKRFGKMTFLAYVHGDIYKNDTGLNDSDLKEFLRAYDEKFKKPVKNFLVEYYRLLHNPDMTFTDTLLDKLGFRKCGHCLGENYFEPEVIEQVEKE